MYSGVWRPTRKNRGRSKLYRGKYRSDSSERFKYVSLRTTDKRIARKKLDAIVLRVERERAGLLPPDELLQGAQCTVLEHLNKFVLDLQARRCDDEYIGKIKQRVRRLAKECHWSRVNDISAASFEDWRSKQSTMAPRTQNHYLQAVRCMWAWLVSHGKAAGKPLSKVKLVKTRGLETVVRRALSFGEMKRLIEVAGVRKVVYLTAVHTGLRRGELTQLCWKDVRLDATPPFLQVRASTTKNGQKADLPLVSEVTELLTDLARNGCEQGTRVFRGIMPLPKTVRSDFDKAGIERQDSRGWLVDFHALRHTFITNMGIAGVDGGLRRQAARHSDQRLTDRVYTDVSQLPMVRAFSALPSYTDDGAQIGAQELVPSRHKLTRSDPTSGHERSRKCLSNKAQRHTVASVGTNGHNAPKTGEGGIRTPGTV